MRKNVLSIALLGILTLSTPFSFVSCKDYDGDVESLNKQTGDLNTQLSALQTALDAAKAEADAAAKSAADAISAADAAAAEAALAKQAAAQAKAEAIAEVMEQVKALLSGKASQDDLDALASKIAGIERSLNTLSTTTDQLVTFMEATKVQLAAMEEFKTLVNAKLAELTAIDNNIQSLLTRIGTVESELASVKSQIAELQNKMSLLVTDADLTDIKSQLTTLSTQIGALGEVGTKLNTLIGVLTNRLTSVTFVPTAYVGGIPCIDFESASYLPKKVVSGKIVNTGASANIINRGNTVAKYRLNPAGVKADDIDAPSFVHEVATTRSSNENTLINVKSAVINSDGILEVTAGKSSTASLNISDSKINIVALKVPISEKARIQGEKAEDAVVYSEYVRIAETTFTPEIGSVKSPVEHFSDSTSIYAIASDINISANYMQGVNLSTIVAGCKVKDTNHSNMSLEELKAYGLTLRYHVATGAYDPASDGTNQQKFAHVDAVTGKVSSQTPDGQLNNAAAVGRTPIIAATLVDTVRNCIVDQRYLKIKFVAGDVTPIDLGNAMTVTRALGCENIEIPFSWVDMNNKVYAKLNAGAGMSKVDFANIYTEAPTVSGHGTVLSYVKAPETATNAIVWTLTPEQIGTILPNTSKDLQVTLTYSDPKHLHGDVTFTFKVTVTITLPSLVGYYEQYWETPGETYNMYPVQYGTPAAATTCTYNNDLWNGFIPVSNSLVKGLNSCGVWDVQFASASGFSVLSNGYTLSKSGAVAAKLWKDSHAQWLNGGADDHTIMVVNKNAAGISLVGNTVAVKILGKINEYNTYTLLNYKVNVVKPLTINTQLEGGAFYDGLISGSAVDCSKAFTMTDFRGYIVSKVNPGSEEKQKYAAELYKYYELEAPVWDLTTAKIGMKNVNGSLVVDDALTAEQSVSLTSAYAKASITKDGDNLVFKNNSGSNVEKACNVFVKVTINYGWGTQSNWVKIRLNPASAQQARRR